MKTPTRPVVPPTWLRWLPVAALSATVAATVLAVAVGGIAGWIAAGVAGAVVLAWLCWAWPTVGALCTSTVAAAAGSVAVSWWITPPWLPGGIDWMVLAACWSLAVAVSLAVLLLPARRGRRWVTAAWCHGLLAVAPLATLPAPGPLLAAVVVVLACWIGWRAGVARLPRVVWAVWAAKRRGRAGAAVRGDRAPAGWPPLPERWTLLRDRKAGRGAAGAPVEGLLMGPFGVACLATADGVDDLAVAAHRAAAAADAVSWSVSMPRHHVHPVVLCPAPAAPNAVWTRGRRTVEVTVLPPSRIRRLATALPAPVSGRGRRAARRATKRATKLAAMMRTLPDVADRLLTVDSGTGG